LIKFEWFSAVKFVSSWSGAKANKCISGSASSTFEGYTIYTPMKCFEASDQPSHTSAEEKANIAFNCLYYVEQVFLECLDRELFYKKEFQSSPPSPHLDL
jgi:hypothetical protein